MEPFAYLSVLTSIVLALVVTRILTGIGELLQARGKLRLLSLPGPGGSDSTQPLQSFS